MWSSDIRHLRTVAPYSGSTPTGEGWNQFGSATRFGQYLFRDCINLATFGLQEASCQQEPQARAEAKELPQGCLSSTGITTLELTWDFQVLGAHACDNCKLLKPVGISNANIEEIQEFTFVHCTSLCEVRLPYTLRTIRVKAFVNCAALPELATPPSLRYIASRAFCTLQANKNSQADTNGGGLMQKKILLPFALPCDGHHGCTWSLTQALRRA